MDEMDLKQPKIKKPLKCLFGAMKPLLKRSRILSLSLGWLLVINDYVSCYAVDTNFQQKYSSHV